MIRMLCTAVVGVSLFISFAVQSAAGQQSSPSSPAPAFTPPQPTPNDSLKSPEIDSSGIVIFRVYAPDAHTVVVHAQGIETTPGITAPDVMKAAAGYPMARADNGVWSYRLGPIQPGVYRYTFAIDGAQTTDPKNPAASESLTYMQSMYEVPGAKFLEYKTDVPHGAIATLWYPSSASGGLRRMHVYTPPGYSSGGEKYPVLYLLHGGSDTDDSWPTVGRAGAIIDNLIAAHQAVPMIVVMPAGHMSRDFQLSMAMNTMGHDKFNEDLCGSVLPYIDKTYRTLADRDHRAIAGLSMGGLQTLTLSLTHSDLFSYIGVFSSGWFPPMREQVEKTDFPQYKANGHPHKLYWVAVGKLDIAKPNSGPTVELLRKYGISPVTHESEGFHAWNNWRDYLNLFAPQLFR